MKRWISGIENPWTWIIQKPPQKLSNDWLQHLEFVLIKLKLIVFSLTYKCKRWSTGLRIPVFYIAMCPEIKKQKKVTLSNLKKPKLNNLYIGNGEMGPPLDQLLYELNRYGSNSLEIFRGRYEIRQALKHQFIHITLLQDNLFFLETEFPH